MLFERLCFFSLYSYQMLQTATLFPFPPIMYTNNFFAQNCICCLGYMWAVLHRLVCLQSIKM